MFGFFKKRPGKPAPSPAPAPAPTRVPSQEKRQQFQACFGTQVIQQALANSIGALSGAILGGEGTKALTNIWNKLWAVNLPDEPPMKPDGLTVDVCRERDLMLVIITFPTLASAGAARVGVIVLGPCEDPKWGAEARETLPFRYFVLRNAANGRSLVEEWTSDTPTPLGPGPAPHAAFFVEWVLHHQLGRPMGNDASMTIPRGDDAMAAAIERARRELPGVLQRFVAGKLGGTAFTVKVAVRDGEHREFFWLSDMVYADGKFSGIIDAEPGMVSTIKRGDRWTAPTEEVVDWMFACDKKMHGNYTLRALLPQMPPAEAAKYRAVLAEVEPDEPGAGAGSHSSDPRAGGFSF
jgi:uncharacterized protein YegJ (DUF2314 family)